jgi:signal transduction histidine kinase
MLQELILQDGTAARFGGAVSVRSFDTINLQVAKGSGQSYTLPYEVYIAPITSQGHQVATLLVGEPSDPSAQLKVLVPGLLVAGPATLLLAAVGGYWLAARALRPVRVITRTAREIEETDLSRRLNISSRDELGELAATFDDMLARLEAAFARQRQFTADASHELRTPLAIVSLEARRALAGERTHEEYERALATIQAESEYMRRLVESLLTLARADAGQAPIERADVDVSDVVVDAVERLAPLARARKVTLAIGALAELTVEGDALLLAQMVGNLVENAVKHGRPGGQVSVDCGTGTGTGTGERAGWAFVRVADDGPGIPAAHLPHIFDRFYRIDTSRSRTDADASRNGDAASSAELPESAGLGLAIVRWGAEAHGGEVTVSSVEGAGSVFTLWLPLPITAPTSAVPSRLPTNLPAPS